MNVSELDIELLETYLDDELVAEEGDLLRRRLALEPTLAAAMDQLRVEREMRRQVFASLESDRGTEPALRAVTRAATSELAWGSRVRILRQISAAAACIIVGVSAGWFAWGRGPSSSMPGPSRGTETVATNRNNSTDARGTRNRFPTNPNASLIVDDLTGRALGRPGAGGYNVSITDDFGRVLAVQHFDTLNEARDFSNDLGKWQNKQRQIRNGNVKLVGDEF